MAVGSMEVGRLSELMRQLGDVAGEITIAPVVEEAGPPLSRPIDDKPPYPKDLRIAGWKITYKTLESTFTVKGNTVAEAVDAALANPDAW